MFTESDFAIENYLHQIRHRKLPNPFTFQWSHYVPPGLTLNTDTASSALTLVVCGVILVTGIFTVSQEECARVREGVPYVKVYRYNPKHLCPKLNGYGDNGQRSLKL